MTGKNWKPKVLAIFVVIALLTSLMAGLTAQAQEPERFLVDPDDVDAVTEVCESATEWIAYFTECPANDIPCEQPQCMGFYDELTAAGCGGNLDSFSWGNCNAWAQDFKRSAAGGTENEWIDDVDIALFCDHGTSTYDSFWGHTLSALHFGCEDPDGDCNVSPGEAYMSYGTNDLEWLGFKACSVLSDGGPAPYRNRGYWAATMNELHLLLGFRNSSYCDDDFGEKWAEYMLGVRWCFFGSCFWLRPPYTVKEAWFAAVDDTQPGGVCARVLAEESYYFNDYLWGRGYVYADYQDGDYYYLDHCTCTPPPKQIPAEMLAQIATLPIVEVVDRDVNEGYVLEIATAFGMETTDVYSDTDYYFMVESTEVETYTLQVDKINGGYSWSNLSALSSTPIDPPELPLAEEALSLGEEFFAGEGQVLPDAGYRNGPWKFEVEERVETLEANPAAGIFQEQEMTRTQEIAILSYGREIPIQAGTRSGDRQQLNLSVVGPGGRVGMKLGDGGEMLAAKGGMHDIAIMADTVDVMLADKAWDLFLQNPEHALAPVPWAADTISRTGETLGYYAHAFTQGQSEMVPTWIFSATFSLGGEVLAEGVLIYFPASESYLPPMVSITAPPPGSEFSPGEMVTFEGEVVEYGQEPFTYEWYSSHDGFLGSGATINAPLSAVVGKGQVFSHTISLQVTDANGQAGTASEMVFVKTRVYLPLILKEE